MLGNKKSFDRMPADLQEIVTRNVNMAGMKVREDVKVLNAGLQADLLPFVIRAAVAAHDGRHGIFTRRHFVDQWHGYSHGLGADAIRFFTPSG